MNNAITWFELPTTNLDRAVAFYSAVLDVEVAKRDFGGEMQGFFPYQDGVGGALIQRADTKPSADGPILYLNAAPDIEGAVGRVTEAGGQVLMPVTPIGDPGVIAIILDSEGNRVGLHMQP